LLADLKQQRGTEGGQTQRRKLGRRARADKRLRRVQGVLSHAFQPVLELMTCPQRFHEPADWIAQQVP